MKLGDRVKFKNLDLTGVVYDRQGKMLVVKTKEGSYYVYDYQLELVEPQPEIEISVKKEIAKVPVDVVDLQQYDLSFNGKTELSLIKVIYNDKATILFYKNKTGQILKSVAKCHPDDKYDREKGLSIALYKALIKEKMKEYSRIFKDLEKLEEGYEKLTE